MTPQLALAEAHAIMTTAVIEATLAGARGASAAAVKRIVRDGEAAARATLGAALGDDAIDVAISQICRKLNPRNER